MVEPAAQRRFTRHRVSWKAILLLDDGRALEGVARDYCFGGAYFAVEGWTASVLPDVGALGQLKLAPPGVPAAVLRVQVRQSSQGGLGVMFIDAAESETSRLMGEATRPQVTARVLSPEARAMHDVLRSMLQKNFEQWGPLWLAALKQRLFRVAAEAPSSLQHRLLDVQTALEAETTPILRDMVRLVLERFDDPSAVTAPKSPPPQPTFESTLEGLQFSLVNNEEFEDFLAEADLASRVEACHRSLIFKVNVMLVAALGMEFDASTGPLSPEALVRGLWLAVQGRTAELAVRQVAQSVFNEMFVSRIGEFYAECARKLTEAGYAREAELKTMVKRSGTERMKAQDELWQGVDEGSEAPSQTPGHGAPALASTKGLARVAAGPALASTKGLARVAAGPALASTKGLARVAAGPALASTKGLARVAAGPALASTKGLARVASDLRGQTPVPARAQEPPGFWTIEDLESVATGQAFDQTLGSLSQTHSFASVARVGQERPIFIGQAQAEALRRLYSRAGAGSSGLRGAPRLQRTPAYIVARAGLEDVAVGDFPAIDPDFESMVDAAWPRSPHAVAELVDTEATQVPYDDLPQPARDVASGFVGDFLNGIANDPRVGVGQRQVLDNLRPAIERAVGHNPAALTDPTHPVRRVASALSRLVWTEGEQAVAPCGLEVASLVERLMMPGKASHHLFTEVARELEATLVQQRQFSLEAADDLVKRHAEQLGIVHTRRRPEELNGSLAEQVPEALEPWVEQARRMNVGDEVVHHRPKRADLLMRLAWIGDERRQFAFVDPAARKLHGMTLQELALHLMRGRIEPLLASDEPVPQALIAMVDAADSWLQEAVSRREDSDLLSEVGLLRELDSLEPEFAHDGQTVDARLACWRARHTNGVPIDWSTLLPKVGEALPEGARLGLLDNGDLVAYAPPGLISTSTWADCIRALTNDIELPAVGGQPAVALRRFRPGEEHPQVVLGRLDLALGGVDPDVWQVPDAGELRAALAGTGSYTLVSDVGLVRGEEDPMAAAVANVIMPRLLEGVPLNTAIVNSDAALARLWDRWILNQAMERSLAEGESGQTIFYVPISDLAIVDDGLLDDVGKRLLESGVAPARLLIELGVASSTQQEALLNTVAALRAYGCSVSLRYRHGIGLTASFLRRAGVSSLRVPDWLAETDKSSSERSMLVQSLVDLCRFIDIRSLAVVPEGSPMRATLRELGIDWIQEVNHGTDGTVRLTRRAPSPPAAEN